eukprot:1728186-Pleurochrysis_carterae.AAC.1
MELVELLLLLVYSRWSNTFQAIHCITKALIPLVLANWSCSGIRRAELACSMMASGAIVRTSCGNLCPARSLVHPMLCWRYGCAN